MTMQPNHANMQRFDQLLENVLRGDGPALRPSTGNNAASAEMAANVQVGQLFRSAMATMPSNEAKNRARARLHAVAAAPAPTPWWNIWSPQVVVRGMAAASAALAVAMVASHATLAPPAPIAAFTIGAPVEVTESVAAAEQQAERSQILAQRGDGVAAVGAVSELTRTLALATQAIAEAGGQDRTAAGVSRLVVSADKVIASLEAESITGEASDQISLKYAEAIESLAIGSPAILGIGGRLQISSAGLRLDGNEHGASLQVSAFRVDSNGGAWESAWTTTSLETGGVEIELPSGTYTRVRFTSSDDAGPSVTSEIPRPFAITTGAVSHISPTTIVWEPVVDEEPQSPAPGVGVSSNDPKAKDEPSHKAGKSHGTADSGPTASVPTAESDSSKPRKGKADGDGNTNNGNHVAAVPAADDDVGGAAFGVTFTSESDNAQGDTPSEGNGRSKADGGSRDGKPFEKSGNDANTSGDKRGDESRGKSKDTEPKATPAVLTTSGETPPPEVTPMVAASSGDVAHENDASGHQSKAERNVRSLALIEPTNEQAQQQPVVANRKGGDNPKNEARGHQPKSEPDSGRTLSRDEDRDSTSASAKDGRASKGDSRRSKSRSHA